MKKKTLKRADGQEYKTVFIRCPKSLHERLVQIAAAQNKSLNRLCVELLQRGQRIDNLLREQGKDDGEAI